MNQTPDTSVLATAVCAWLDSEESDEADIFLESVLLAQTVISKADHYFFEDQCREHDVFHLFVHDDKSDEFKCIEIGRDGQITRF